MDTYKLDADGAVMIRANHSKAKELRPFDLVARPAANQPVTPPAHRLRASPGGTLGIFCGPDCPACAQDRARKAMMIDGVREIILGMWLEAIREGDRTLETALRELSGPLAKLSFRDRSRLGWAFVEAAMAAPVNKGRIGTPPRGLPSAWRLANMQIVDMVNEIEGLALTPVANEHDMRTAFHRVAGIWNDWGIAATPLPVEDAYWRQKRVTGTL